ncbi:MAG: sigma-70 family RNA polymerase sigma factor [Leptospiraceae bacterium]|nr:sigma-70 family RNA polymerase sigma factor [Leptospiraceae bacterium]
MDKYQDQVFAQALKYTGNPDEAEDITQEVFLKAYESLSAFRGESQFSSWLYRITQNELIKRIRTRSRLPEQLEENPETSFSYSDMFKKWSASLSPEVNLIKEEMAQRIHSLIGRLPLNYKKPLVLYYFDNMSYKEISESLNLKMNTLKSYIFRGKELMKEWINKDEDRE